jgi:predicted phage tail protein
MMKIRLEGVAGKRFGYEHELNVRTPNEALRALCQLLPGFRSFLSSAHEFGIYFQIISRNTSVGYEDLAFGTTEFSLVPVITGSFFGSNFGKILIGVIIVALALTAFGGLITWGAAGTFSAGVKSAMVALGLSLVFTGVAGLFAPGVPEPSSKQEGRPADDAITNAASATAADGTPVPVVYGETLVTRMPVVSSYIQDGADFDEPEGFWMAVVSEGEIDGFAGSQEDNLFFNGLKASAAGVKDIQFTDGTQTSSSSLNLLQNQGFHLRIGSTFPIAGGSYENRLSESESPNTTEIRSINNPYADKIRVRVLEGAFYQTKTRNTQHDGKTKSSFRDYTETDDSGGADNPLRYVVTAFANGVQFYQEEYPRRLVTVKDESTPDLNDTKEELQKVDKVLSNTVAVHEIPITGLQHPISVKIERTDRGAARGPKSKKGDNSTRQYNWVKGDITWLSMEVLWNEKLVYPFTSMLACSFPAGATTSLPAITAKIRGRKVPVVSRNLSINYEYSRNPACVVLDLLTNTRYGAGQRTFTTNAPLSQVVYQPGIRLDVLGNGSVSSTDIDLASFYKAQKYCDEHNITFDATISGDADTIELLRSITSTFQGQLVYIGGAITVVIDDQVKDDQIQDYRLFTEANVIQESSGEGIDTPCFVYEGTARKARSTAVQVSYIDSANFYKETKVLVEDRDAMQKYGYNLKKIRALGCTDRNLAKRLGRYTLATNIRSTETVMFSVGPEGAMLLPGDVCIIGDPLKTRIESGGRIISAIPSQLLVDRELTSNNSYGSGDWKLYTYTNAGIAQKNTVSSVTGSSINIQGSFSSLPSSNMMWILVNEGATNNYGNQFNRYRVQKITEDADGTFSIIGIKYDHAKYDYVNTDEVDYGGTRLLSGGRNKALRTNSISFKIRNPSP